MEIDFVHDWEGDWVGLYVDGKLALEGHSLTPEMVLTRLGIEIDCHNVAVDMVCDLYLNDMLKRTVQ